MELTVVFYRTERRLRAGGYWLALFRGRHTVYEHRMPQARNEAEANDMARQFAAAHDYHVKENA